MRGFLGAMAIWVVIGAQWGDEGKGKVVDFLAQDMDYVVRYQGGANAGHTVRRKEWSFRFHLLPTGVLYPHVTAVIGPGVAVDLEQLAHEIAEFEGLFGRKPRLRISPGAHIVMPYHRLLDQLEERRLGRKGIGTTRRGIGPCYADRVARKGFRLADLERKDWFLERLEAVLEEKNALLQHLYGRKRLPTAESIWKRLRRAYQGIREYVMEVRPELRKALHEGKEILFEGAQGVLLDVELGTYPHVTSSHTVPAGISAYMGVSVRQVREVIGVAKAYCTRVGAGVFPTEIRDARLQAWLRERGQEYGTTTGRPRRCGWLDLPLLRYAVRVADITTLAITKLDVFSGLPEVRFAVAYRWKGRQLEEPPEDLGWLAECEPIYDRLPGWTLPSQIRSPADLPAPARAYLRRIEQELGIPVFLISYSAETADTLRLIG